MEQSDRDSIDQFIAFQDDLIRLRTMMVEYRQRADDLEAQYGGYEPTPKPPDEMVALRQDVLRRSGPIRVVFERVIGRVMQPQPWQVGPPINIWDLALHEHTGFNQEHFLERVADHLNVLIGRLESDPSLLNPPTPQESARMLQPINVYGGTVNIAQTGSGDISQSITVQQETAAVRHMLAELEDAIREVQAPEDELENFLEPVEQLNSELAKSRPLISRLTRSWGR